jgi:hypothetical protein
MLSHVALVRTDVSEERITSVIEVTRIGELGTLAVTSNRSMLRRNNIPEDRILLVAIFRNIFGLCGLS